MPRCLQRLINENVCRNSGPWAGHKIQTYFQQRTEELLYKKATHFENKWILAIHEFQNKAEFVVSNHTTQIFNSITSYQIRYIVALDVSLVLKFNGYILVLVCQNILSQIYLSPSRPNNHKTVLQIHIFNYMIKVLFNIAFSQGNYF